MEKSRDILVSFILAHSSNYSDALVLYKMSLEELKNIAMNETMTTDDNYQRLAYRLTCSE